MFYNRFSLFSTDAYKKQKSVRNRHVTFLVRRPSCRLYGGRRVMCAAGVVRAYGGRRTRRDREEEGRRISGAGEGVLKIKKGVMAKKQGESLLQ